jgi:hypothetical protein
MVSRPTVQEKIVGKNANAPHEEVLREFLQADHAGPIVRGERARGGASPLEVLWLQTIVDRRADAYLLTQDHAKGQQARTP